MNPVLEGTTIQLNCSATLRGDITYTWTKDSGNLPSDPQFQPNPTQGYLRITMVTEDSAGMYVCTARNSEGSVTSSAPYTLQIRPVERKEFTYLRANPSKEIFLTRVNFWGQNFSLFEAIHYNTKS